MKKYIVLAAAAIATLASCTKNEVAAPKSNEISFKALTVKAKKTKAVINDNFYPKNAPAFKVWATYNDGTNTSLYVDGATCGYVESSDLWESTPKAYWPLSGTLTFTAFSPADANALAYNSAQKKITATGLTADPQVEFLYSNPADAKDLTSTSTALEDYLEAQGTNAIVGNNGVPVVFQHALSQVLVYAKSGNAKTKYKVTSVVLKTLDTANLTLTEKADNTYTVEWSTPTTNAVSDELAVAEASRPEVTSADYVSVTSAGWLVMPQTLAANTGANEGKQVLEIKYKMWYDNSSTATPNWVPAGETADAKIVPLYLEDADANVLLDEFVAGKKYVLDLIISPEEIKYAPRVASWVDETINHYDVQ